jgi:4-hydroxybenzoate polyprenyltransferase
VAFVVALPWGPWVAIVPLSVIGLLAYSKWALPGRRIKDRLLLKNAAVAISITALALALAHAGGGATAWVLGAVAPVLVFRVFADAMRCDIDDVNADQRHGTRTFANTFGVQAAWRGALVLDGCAALAALALVPVVGWGISIAVGSVPLIGGIALTVLQPKPSRDLVDALGAVGVLLAWGLVSVGL